MKNSISRKLIESFILQKRLHNVVGLLEYLKSVKHIEIFTDYIRRHEKKALIVDPRTKIIFHGSQSNLEKLKISQEEKLIYATDSPNYAIFLAILNLKNATAGVLIKKGVAHLTIDHAFVNGLSSFKNGWIHILSAKSFKKAENHEYISKQSIPVLFSIPVTPRDLTVPINVLL
jgi:hypothetical protein